MRWGNADRGREALGVKLRGGHVTAEGDLDVRGTLGIEKDVPVGFKQIRLRIVLDTDATRTSERGSWN